MNTETIQKDTGITLSDGERLDTVNENITLIQKKSGLTFGSDAFLLSTFIKEQKNAYAAELGAGCGIISLLCASRGTLGKIYAFEVQKDYAEVCQKNVCLNRLGEKIDVICKDIRDCKASDLGRELDVVFSNPPYMKTESGKRNNDDGKYIARHEVCGDIGDFCACAARLLKFGGRFYVVYRPDRMPELFSALKREKLEPKRMATVFADEYSEPSIVLIEAVKGGAPSMKLLPPIIIYSDKKTKTMTYTANKIYETGKFPF